MTMMSPEKKATELLIRANTHPHNTKKKTVNKNTKKKLFLIYCINVRGLTSQQYKNKTGQWQILEQSGIQNQTKYIRGKREKRKMIWTWARGNS